VEKNEVGQVKKVRSDTLEGGDTRVKAIKNDSNSDSDKQKKRLLVFEKKKPGVTPQNWRLKRSPGYSGKK